jgi:integrase
VTVIRLKHVHRFRDRHGRVRFYLRMPGRASVALPADPGSPAFLAAYQAAMQDATPRAPGEAPGTFDALCVAYYRGQRFAGLRASTARSYRLILEEMRAAHGTKPARLLDADGVRALMAEKVGKPGAANNRLRVLRHLAAHAVEARLVPADFTAGVKKIRAKAVGFHTWTEPEIEAFLARWPAGSTPRLALLLLLCTGSRRSDAVMLGLQHIRGGRLHIRQAKTGAEVQIPIMPALAAELERVPADRLVFLATSRGVPFTSNGFANSFKDWSRAAGLDHWSSHGGRKACARRLAEAGASAMEIAAVTGHSSLREVERYTAAANRGRLADAAMARIVPLPKNRKRPAACKPGA